MNTINNDNRTKKEVIDTFLEDVEKKLPFWLRGEKEELKEILEELETHIWDGASELAEGNDPSIEQIEQVIEQLGSPSKIAEEYKHRGKPKFYITEELFPIYTKVLILVAGVIFAFNLLGMLLSIGSQTVGGLFGNLFGGFFTSLAIAVILLTIQFVYLSREGYLPENFQRLTSRLPFSLKKYFDSKKKSTDTKKRYDEEPAKTTTESYAATEEVMKDDEPKVKIISERTFAEPQVIKETIIVKEPRRTRDRDEPRPERVVKYSYRNTLSEGITGMVFGTVFAILPFFPLLDFIGFYLSIWISVFGGVMIIGGMI
ncbi:MAG: HAAS signaling domain-containing protein, partial [Candidatus Hodarchaeales archaeon]